MKDLDDDFDQEHLDGCLEQRGSTPPCSPLDMLNSNKQVKICAPMVRYSRLAFRTLVRKYNCDIAYSPMIISSSFVQSAKARDNEFSTNSGDRPLIIQFAANNAKDLADAAEIVLPYCDGIDLNCGCPQRWAMSEGYGSCLLKKPQLISEMVSSVKSRTCHDSNFTVSIKIRLNENIRKTVELCQQAVHAGVSWITVHGRTPSQRSQPVNYEAIKLLADCIPVPIVANGDIKSLADAENVYRQTSVNGVMAARGLLANPAMFAGFDRTPVECIFEWVKIASQLGTSFQTFHQHLIFMLDNVLSKSERRIFNSLSSTAAVLDYLNDTFIAAD